MAGRQTIPGAKAPTPKKKSSKAKAAAKEAKKAKKPSTSKGTGNKSKILFIHLFFCQLDFGINGSLILCFHFDLIKNALD